MILYNASDIKVGSEQVDEIRLGTELIWPISLWNFNTPAGGEEIEVIATFSGSVQINWGDGDIDTLTSNVGVTHTYS